MLIAVAVAAVAGCAASACRSRPSAPASAAFRAALPVAGAAAALARARCRRCCRTPISFALLGAIESLLSAVVADGMTGRRHRSNCELVAQGVANIALGAVRRHLRHRHHRPHRHQRAGRRARARSPGMLHALFLLVFMLVAAPLASYIPLAALAGVLAVVAWNMVEKHAFATLLRASRGDAIVLLATFLLTVFRDLTEASWSASRSARCCSSTAWRRPSAVETHAPLVADDMADAPTAAATPYDAGEATDPDIVVYRIPARSSSARPRPSAGCSTASPTSARSFILDLSAVPFLDSTGRQHHRGRRPQGRRAGVRFVIPARRRRHGRCSSRHGVKPPAGDLCRLDQGRAGATQSRTRKLSRQVRCPMRPAMPTVQPRFKHETTFMSRTLICQAAESRFAECVTRLRKIEVIPCRPRLHLNFAAFRA